MSKYYLAYGSNLNLNCMDIRCPFAKVVGTIDLPNYRLVYKGCDDGAAYLTIEEFKDSFVPMGLFKVRNFDIHRLDVYEGYPKLYYKKFIPVIIGKKKINALVYVMNDEFTYHKPANHYVNTCKNGYIDFGFDLDILDKAYTDTEDMMDKNKQLIR